MIDQEYYMLQKKKDQEYYNQYVIGSTTFSAPGQA